MPTATLPERAEVVLERAYARFTDNRKRTTTDGEYTQSEAFRAVQEADEPFTDLTHDIVVLSGYYDLSANERAVIDQLANVLPLVILLPTVDTPSEHTGANAVAAEALSFYRDLADETRHVTPESQSGLNKAASKLYTPNTNTNQTAPKEILRWVKAPTPDREVRQIARSLRNRLATDDVDPGDVLVIVPGLISYREHIEDEFAAHGIEQVTFANKLLYQTYGGDAMLALVKLCEDESGADLLARLATNPVVSLDNVDSSGLADLARRLPTDDPERLFEELDDESSAAIEALVDQANRVGETKALETVDGLRSLFDHVELDIRPLHVEVDPLVDAIRNGDFLAVLALHPLPARSEVGVQRSLADRIIFGLDAEVELPHRLKLEVSPRRQSRARMREPGVLIGKGNLPHLITDVELAALTATALLQAAVAREERIETVLNEEEMRRELVGRGLD